jgi:pilus assembly protein CpaB
MRMMFGLVLIVGIALAGFAVYMAKGYVNNYQAELAAERAARAKIVPTVPVFVAAKAMRYGQRLTKEDVAVVQWPENALPEGSFTDEAALFPADGRPRTVLRAMEKDEAIMAIKVTEPGEDAGVSSRLSTGMRAFAIEVNVSTGVSGFLRPGDRVDVYWTGQVSGVMLEGSTSGDVTKLIEPGIRLIAVDQTADGDTTTAAIARTVTVEATPQQVARLAQAQSTGRLSLSLLGADDQTTASVVNVDQSRLLGIEATPVTEAPQQKVCTIKTRKGADLVETPIPCTN